MRDATLCILQKFTPEMEVCLGMKKIGFGQGKWNGIGGKVGDNVKETIEEAAIRETKEEIGVTVTEFHKVAELTFIFPNKQEWSQVVHVFLVTGWEGEPTESNEMAPKWFKQNEIPYSQMWSSDQIWQPLVLEGKKLKGTFMCEGDDLIGEPEIELASD